ncbi:thioredoxin family protein [Sphingobacterium lumbrici]|uniref:thioredoxin family protein n=1 Tax=Sphingobacterium lumbrici TaxID=2559600 RepID=UPI00112A5AE5|nr:thioredoxin family protein [Sphingobacterium lumbrici]
MKLIYIYISAVGIFLSLTSVAQDRSIVFETGSWEEIKAKAAKEKKPIFMDAFTTWCGPCKKIAAEVFTRNEVADYFNANFINAKIDMEKGDGPALAKLYSIKAYPSLLFIDGEGKLINKREGALDAATFLDFGKKSSSGEAMEYLVSEYKNGNRDFEFMKKYLLRVEGLRQNIGVVVDEYFQQLPQSKWNDEGSWYFISRYVRSEDSPVFKFIVKNQAAFDQKYTADVVADYMVSVYRNSIHKAANSVFAAEDLADLKAEFAASDFREKERLIMQCDAIIADINGDKKTYVDLMQVMFTKYPDPNLEFHINYMNEVCRKLLKYARDPYVLNKAAEIASVAMKYENAYFMDAYACLLVEIGEIDKAIEVEEKAIALLRIKPSAQYPISAFEGQIAKFKRRKAL